MVLDDGALSITYKLALKLPMICRTIEISSTNAARRRRRSKTKPPRRKPPNHSQDFSHPQEKAKLKLSVTNLLFEYGMHYTVVSSTALDLEIVSGDCSWSHTQPALPDHRTNLMQREARAEKMKAIAHDCSGKCRCCSYWTGERSHSAYERLLQWETGHPMMPHDEQLQ